eukprot:4644725-Prymnesium_polylepis.1
MVHSDEGDSFLGDVPDEHALFVVPPAIVEVYVERQVLAAIFDGVRGEKRVIFLHGARDVLVLVGVPAEVE